MGIKRVLLFIAAAVVLFAAGYGLHRPAKGNLNGEQSEQAERHKYPLLAKELFIDGANDPLINFVSLRQSLKQYFADNNLDGSLYFEYLPTGTNIRIDGEEEETAASLLKVPAAMDLYRASELGKINLDKTISLKPEWLDSAYGDLYKKGAGYQLTLREAAKIMLEQSDNTAVKAIGFTMNDAGANDPVNNVFNSVDADIMQNRDLTVAIGARSYSSVLKCLYYSCYLTNKDSQELLDYLSHTPFNNRLIAGIANKDITVAHKIGVNSQTTQSDCGIVYIPNRHYILCVLIKGQDSASTDKHIAALSKLSYNYVIK